MPRRKAILAAVAASLPTTGDDLVFASVHRGFARPLEDSELPAAVVMRGEETTPADMQFPRESVALRELEVEVEVVMKHTENLDDAMDDYLEAVEQSVVYDTELSALVRRVTLDGVSEIEYDDESEKPVATTAVRFVISYDHWPADPSTSPVADPYASP